MRKREERSKGTKEPVKECVIVLCACMYTSYKAVLIVHKLAYFSPLINIFFSSYSLTTEKH